jgi:HD-like signal output (HDOD) protein
MNSPTIVFIDDDLSILNTLKRLLRLNHRDWDMYFFSSSMQALEHLAQISPWVIVADLQMSGMDGVELLKRATVISPQSIRVLLTGDAQLESALKASTVAHIVIRKPFERDQIESLLTRARVLHQLPLSDAIRMCLGKLNGLPILPKVYQQITQALDKEEPDVTEVAGLIRHDQALLSRVLQLVNSPFFRCNSSTNDVSIAVMRLGLQTIHNLVLIIELYQTGGSVEPVLSSRLMREALLLAEGVGVLCDSRGVTKGIRNLAVISALLHNIGQLVCRGGCREYPLVGAYLLELWGFESEMIEAVQHQLDDDLPENCELATELLNTVLKLQYSSTGGRQDGACE